MKRLNSAATLSDLPEVSTPEAARECLGSYRKADEKDKTVIILDELLNVLPEDEEGKGNLICDIIVRHRNNQLQELAEEIRTSLLVPCKLLSDTCHPSDIWRLCHSCKYTVKAAGGRTPRTSRILSSSSSGAEPNIESRGQAALRKTCLVRDGNRCVITGRYDENKAQELELTDEDREGILTGWTECAHTIPFSTAPRSSSDGAVDSSEVQRVSSHSPQKGPSDPFFYH